MNKSDQKFEEGERVWYHSVHYKTWRPGPATVVRMSDKPGRVIIKFEKHARTRSVASKHLFREDPWKNS